MKANVKYTGLDVANRIRFDAEATFKQGATFTPTITPEGVLSWSNNGGLDNPMTVNLRGPQGERGEQGEQGVQGIQGVKGEKGAPFTIYRTYPSVAAMNDDVANVPDGQMVLINTDDVNDADNAKLFVKANDAFSFVTDMSGADGLKGEKGDKGDQGVQGLQGIQGVKGDPGTTDYLQLTNRPSLVSLERNTAYAVGDVVYSKKLPAGYYLVCTTAGTTGNKEPDLKAAVSSGVGITDGSCVFGVKQIDGIKNATYAQRTKINDFGVIITTVGDFKAAILAQLKTMGNGEVAHFKLQSRSIFDLKDNWNDDSHVIASGYVINSIFIINSYNGTYSFLGIVTYNEQVFYSVILNTNFQPIYQIAAKSIDGTITAKTQATTDVSTNVATTEFVKNAINAAFAAKGL